MRCSTLNKIVCCISRLLCEQDDDDEDEQSSESSGEEGEGSDSAEGSDAPVELAQEQDVNSDSDFMEVIDEHDSDSGDDQITEENES